MSNSKKHEVDDEYIKKYYKDPQQIFKLKKKLRRIYMNYCNRREAYDCGRILAQYIAPDIKGLEDRFNHIAAQLRAIDPECPDNLKLG